MPIKIYHQCGHHGKWNRTSFTDDNCGHGLILSAVHQKKDEIEKMDLSLRQKSLFDPQYYLPNSQKSKLKTYDFFPETITDGYSTADFSLSAMESAQKCIDFQVSCDFEKIIIPARYFDQMDPDYIVKQEGYTVHPFLKTIEDQNLRKDIYLTLPMTSHMIESETYRTMLLNWVTSYPQITGVYLFAENGNDEKQISSESFLMSYLEFLLALKQADLRILVGYCNTESLLMTLVGDLEFTFGSYENTRMFSIDKFVVADEDRRGPKPRIYLPSLLNWIQFNQARDIKSMDADVWSKIYRPTNYAEDTLAAATEPTFNQPSLYKHHFICFQEQMSELENLSLSDRYAKLREWIKNAISHVEAINRLPYDLEKHGKGDHLQSWLNTVNKYYAKYLKV